MEQALAAYLNWGKYNIHPYVVDFNKELGDVFVSNRIRLGVTGTNSGFYAPQGRSLRLAPVIRDFNEKLAGFSYGDLRITNLEMETAAIYGIAKLHGHRAVSLNAILANRATGEFSKQGHKAIDELIQYTLEHIAESHLV